MKVSYSLDRTDNRWTTVHAHDTYGHGTHVAGLVAGSHVGVAPGAELTNVIMIRKGTGMLSDFDEAYVSTGIYQKRHLCFHQETWEPDDSLHVGTASTVPKSTGDHSA